MTTYPFVQSFHDLGTARGPRLAMCWHMAEGGGTVGFLSRANAHGVSVHFVIETSGRIVQMLRLDHMHSSIRTSDIRTTNDSPYTYQGEDVVYGRTPAKAALGDWADVAHGTLGPNHATIAVEVEGYAANGPNQAQTTAIASLAKDLALPANLGHRDFADYKACPGKRFPWPSTGGHGTVTTEEPVNWSSNTPVLIDLPLGAQLYDSAGAPLVKVSPTGVQTGVVSPFELEVNANRHLRAAYIVTGGERVVAFIHNPDANIRPVPVADCVEAVKQAVAADRLKAKVVWT